MSPWMSLNDPKIQLSAQIATLNWLQAFMIEEYIDNLQQDPIVINSDTVQDLAYICIRICILEVMWH